MARAKAKRPKTLMEATVYDAFQAVVASFTDPH